MGAMGLSERIVHAFRRGMAADAHRLAKRILTCERARVAVRVVGGEAEAVADESDETIKRGEIK
ncbi:MAG TPA: hypothetical protein VK777_08940, partial [Reyranella sp.]|nr:hypothetical protein [Reyranella sp.]